DRKGTIFTYDEPEDEWHKCAEVQHNTYAYGMVLMQDNIIYVGGERNGKITNGVKSWSFKTRTWRALPSMIHTRSWPSVVLLNNSIYVIGGEVTNGQPKRSVEMYSPGGKWKLVSSMITPRSQAGAVALNCKIFVMGGFDGTDDSQSVECYDPSSNNWTLCEDMNKAHNFPSVAVHNDYIYVLGGITENRTVERYDPQMNEWTMVCSLNVGRGCMGCVWKGDQLWVVGGEQNDKMKNYVSVYYAEYNKWFKRSPIPITDRYSCYVVPKTLLQSQ
ncbi:PREDICTED: kelch-like protein 5, partial [Rhagoletis zephyria]|uniref:kelch-like protein 5 n=1 Tax=Rhagoletis zephyria TaxID=28612 RepID=UPI000811A2B9